MQWAVYITKSVNLSLPLFYSFSVSIKKQVKTLLRYRNIIFEPCLKEFVKTYLCETTTSVCCSYCCCCFKKHCWAWPFGNLLHSLSKPAFLINCLCSLRLGSLKRLKWESLCVILGSYKQGTNVWLVFYSLNCWPIWNALPLYDQSFHYRGENSMLSSPSLKPVRALS